MQAPLNFSGSGGAHANANSNANATASAHDDADINIDTDCDARPSANAYAKCAPHADTCVNVRSTEPNGAKNINATLTRVDGCGADVTST